MFLLGADFAKFICILFAKRFHFLPELILSRLMLCTAYADDWEVRGWTDGSLPSCSDNLMYVGNFNISCKYKITNGSFLFQDTILPYYLPSEIRVTVRYFEANGMLCYYEKLSVFSSSSSPAVSVFSGLVCRARITPGFESPYLEARLLVDNSIQRNLDKICKIHK